MYSVSILFPGTVAAVYAVVVVKFKKENRFNNTTPTTQLMDNIISWRDFFNQISSMTATELTSVVGIAAL